MPAADLPAADRADAQALLKAGFSGLTEARFLLLRIADPVAARAWLAQAPVTTIADMDRDLDCVLQVAITARGLRGLGVPAEAVAGFSDEFLSGMGGEEAHSRRLGDTGANAPGQWRWGGAREPDLLVILLAKAALDAFENRVTGERFSQGFERLETLGTSDMQGQEPFGFRDGVSQPHIDWAGTRRPGAGADLEFGNLIARGEFLLGYRNEYDQYTDRPLLDPLTEGARGLPVAEEDSGQRDLGRNGTYLVFRELHQDVRGFWRCMAAHAGQDGAASLAATLVGRLLTGEPLIAPESQPIRGIGPSTEEILRNGFTFDADPDGLRCPFGAHIRRANPRTADMPGGRQSRFAQFVRMLGLGRPELQQDLIASSRFHRILRRGREFGMAISPQDAMRPEAPDPASGLHFICLNANISRQFEFVQNAWLMNAKFAGMSGESDPLLGNREEFPRGHPTDGFSRIHPNGLRHSISLPQFVTVRGGAYFFLPGLRALRFFAAAG